MSAKGQLIGVGVGPGDPELITFRAARALREADVVAYFAKAGCRGHARTIAQVHLKHGQQKCEAVLRPDMRKISNLEQLLDSERIGSALESEVEEIPLYYPLTTEIPKESAEYCAAMARFYDDSAARLATHLDQGKRIAVLCEGDPMLYGSYMHLHVRLAQAYPTEVVPGIAGMSGCWSMAGAPMVQGDDVLCVIPGTLPEEALTRRLRDADAAVIMKLGRNLPKVRRALAAAGKLNRALYVERGTMQDARVLPLAEKPDDAAPYFALILVPGWEGRA